MKTYIENSFGWNESDKYGCAIQSLSCTRIIFHNDAPIGVVKVEAYDGLRSTPANSRWSFYGLVVELDQRSLATLSKKRELERKKSGFTY